MFTMAAMIILVKMVEPAQMPKTAIQPSSPVAVGMVIWVLYVR